jgi:hypothetical protein
VPKDTKLKVPITAIECQILSSLVISRILRGVIKGVLIEGQRDGVGVAL